MTPVPMLNFHPMVVPLAVVDALNELLEAEQNSIFRFMGESSPYLSRASADIRRPLQQMLEVREVHCRELHELVEDLGGYPHPKTLQPEEQYLAYLSLKFILPKLVDAKKLTIRRYETTIKAVSTAPATVFEILRRHLTDHKAELAVLEKATLELSARK